MRAMVAQEDGPFEAREEVSDFPESRIRQERLTRDAELIHALLPLPALVLDHPRHRHSRRIILGVFGS